MHKKLLFSAIVCLIIVCIIILLYNHSNRTSTGSGLLPQRINPTSTSAPTPTSIYGNQSNRPENVTPNPATTITLNVTGFVPQVLTIHRGQTVTWVNNSGQQATVNSDPHPTHTAYPPLNLGEFNDGDSLSLRFPKTGRYGYHNHFDATQTGTIIVD